MTKDKAKIRIDSLRKEINHHRYMYHVMDKLEISEAALDSLKHELYKLEQEFPDLITPDSPTQRVGGEPLGKFDKVIHRSRMLSLEDAFSMEELKEWGQRIKRIFPERKFDFFAELKIDGFAISLKYEKGLFVVGATRGDGFIGEDVTQNLKTIESIPLKLEIDGKKAEQAVRDGIFSREIMENIKKAIESGSIEIRGEVYMTKKVFDEINKEQKNKGLPLYANPRNTAAGSIRQLDPKIAASRKLEFLAYDVVTDFEQKTHKDEHTICDLFGFRTDKLARFCNDENEIIEFWKEIEEKREKLNHLIDGIVVSVNNNRLFEDLGVVGKAPKGAVAFKFAPEETTTIVEDISVHIGRTGAVTPVAHLKPVRVGGVTISRASLHNIDEINRLGLKIGDTVIVSRAGDVIPDVVKVLDGLRSGKEKKFHMPEKCPVCKEQIVRPEGEVAHRCINKKCPAKKRENLYHFVSRKAFNIVGLGPKIIDALFNGGLIQDAADFYDLKEGDLVPMERFAEKSAENLVNSIAKSKEISLLKFIYSLGILHVGEETAGTIAKQLSRQVKGEKLKVDKVFEILQKMSVEDLQKFPDIGPKVAHSIYDWFHDKTNIEFLEKLDKVGIEISFKFQTSSFKLKGLSFVLTGEMDEMSRDMAKDRIRDLGGDVSESVSKKTSFVVVGKNPGSKYDKTRKLGVKILNEKEFLKLVGGK